MHPSSQVDPQIELTKVELSTSMDRAGPCPSGKYLPFIDMVVTYIILNVCAAASCQIIVSISGVMLSHRGGLGTILI